MTARLTNMNGTGDRNGRKLDSLVVEDTNVS
jgi:hypothetical protein